MVKSIIFFSKLLTFSALAFASVSNVVVAQDTPTSPQQNTTQKICSSDPVESLLPPLPGQTRGNNSTLSYLAAQGFTQSEEGSWVCYVNDAKKEGRYYTLFKVQEVNGKLIGSSFLDGGNLIAGQDRRSLDFFMTLIANHTSINPDNRQSIRRYLEAFISLVEDGKIQPSRRGFVFDQPNRALVIYHKLTTGELQGTAITLNLQVPKNVSSGSLRNGLSTSSQETLKPNP
ncbi:hypothetical protein [Anabaena subtropica]|uniref:Uncharacterized protein n=1 Tax=Anabaena subtropica FACHB-260 TaxID=2692884 RepID=A0ABR8CNU8_9NOST|nr:hypothetical protein [Anabaena subtropica]MBD2344724.1 hypothetical protein [Anabaena subtropica FACHB-260]